MTMRKVSVQVTYVTQYGTVPSSATQTPATVGYAYAEEHLPELAADGYTFCGWYSTSTFDEGTLVNAGDTVPQNPTLYAKWEHITVASTLTSLADEIRTLSGATDPLGLGEMKTHVAEANNKIDAQTDLIAQISEALEGKAVGGGSTGGMSLETCNFTVNNPDNKGIFADYMSVENGALVVKEAAYWVENISVVRGSLISIVTDSVWGFNRMNVTCNNCELIRSAIDYVTEDGTVWAYNIALNADAETASITISY